ncbi:MAG: MBL fold metallo-hydrolase [Acidimicrobiia bacterium]|nr:MBL fold metallo-hydrolase [Acidimicrobiia bacterium]
MLDRLPLRHRNDPSVQHDVDFTRHGHQLPAGLELTWLGTAGFALIYEGTTIVIDPYVSRTSLADTARNRPLVSDETLVDRLLPRADAVLVGHTHFDHAVDVPALVARDGCTVYGSSSAQHLLGLFGLADNAVTVLPHACYEIGPFTVSFTPSVHSKLLAGWKVPSDGELTCDCLDGLGAGAYRCGQVWGITIEVAGITLYHQGSANLIDDEIRAHGVDIFLCGIAGRIYTRHFVERILRRLDPAVVVAHHHDDFFRPVEGPMGYSFNVNLGGFVEEVARVAPDVPVRTLQPLQTVGAATV